MKYIIPILIVLFAVTGCNKDDNFVANDEQVASSKVTYFALITMKGDKYMSLVKGDTYTDPGATATEKGAPISVTTSGKVDTNVPGLYTVTYTAINKDGFAATKSRTVVVLSGHEAPGVDVSGTYKYVGGDFEATVEKVAEGLYTMDNFYGPTTIACVFTTLDGLTVEIPEQTTGYGPVYGAGTISLTGKMSIKFDLPKQGIYNKARSWQLQ
ncbi:MULTISPECIES: DUF5011 domain-containing protein [Niastella]|uniref:DUF5011 domain-containing protein n=1 Tax=Niastella soli TaxID=2821487 RepID=A0ABS3YSV1_9BACT|nr:DUF5011 domain-containing protein [Niastella soli]MBO9200943.1 DUF5011 domain-containing protein [Niastella soli]